jgi:hypothetical protein
MGLTDNVKGSRLIQADVGQLRVVRETNLGKFIGGEKV